MTTDSFLSENITLLFLYLAFAFFFLGLWLGWVLWRKDKSERVESVSHSGHPHLETSIRPMLNPASYSRSKIKSECLTTAKEDICVKSDGPNSGEVNEASKKESVNADLPTAWHGLFDDVSSGKAHVDDSLGLVYSEPPEHKDDLTDIKGVGKVLNGKLNSFGIYTYRQIAGWNDSIIAEFSTTLSFKNRIHRDDWIGQVKALHKEKYREDLG